MSHTQCDARQRSRFELWSSEHWGHRGARGINPAYNAAFLINGGSGSAVWKNATLSNSLIECCEKNNVLPDSGDHDNGQGRVVSTQSHCFLTTVSIKSNRFFRSFSSSCRIVHDQHLLQFHPPQAPPKFSAYWDFTVLYIHLPLPVHLSFFSIKPQLKALMYPDRACHLMAT